MTVKKRDTAQAVARATGVTNLDTSQPLTPKRSVPTRPGKNGGTLRSGNPDAKGGDFSSKARKIRLAYLAETFLDKAPAVVSDPDHPKFAEVGKWATEMVEGKPTQRIEAEETPSLQQQETGDQVMTRVLAMMGRALLAAPAAQRLQVIGELERADGQG